MHKESNFEHSIEQSLLQHGGYSKGDPLAYDKRLERVKKLEEEEIDLFTSQFSSFQPSLTAS